MKHHFWTLWQGPIIGRTVSHLWWSYPWCLFLEFGRLTEGERFPDGRLGNPRGEWGMTSMDTWPLWTLRSGGRVSATSEYPEFARGRALRLLLGQAFESLEFNESSRRTRLKFSRGLVLYTRVNITSLRGEAFWLLRCPDSGPDDWQRIPPGPYNNKSAKSA